MPQLQLGRWLSAMTHSGGAIDVSDGLALDLHRLCEASQVGAELEFDLLPLPEGYRQWTRALGEDWQRLALGGGEDYVLLFTLPSRITPPDEFQCIRIGSIVVEQQIHLTMSDGDRTQLARHGWDHLTPRESPPDVGARTTK